MARSHRPADERRYAATGGTSGCGLVALVLVLWLAQTAGAAAPGCRDVCRSAAVAGWNRQQTKRCIKQCTKQCRSQCDKSSCKGTAAVDSCNERTGDCALRCSDAWGGASQGTDRGACQAACNSCQPAGREFCVELSSSDRVAHCCGGDSGRLCCSQPGFTNLCCGDALTCCADPVVPGSSVRMPACVDVQTTARHCGQCDKACPAGAAECCAGKCADLQTDPLNCGTCGRLCTVGQTCQNGSCIEVCTGDQILCKASARACCSPAATCCADADNAYQGDWCWTPERVSSFVFRPATAITCCAGVFPPPGDGKSYTWACPAADSCCIGSQGIDCCQPGFQCRPGIGHCEAIP